VEIIGDVVAVVAQWRRIKRQQPNGRDAKLLEILELLNQAAKIADAVTIAVMKGFDMQLVDDRVFVPKRIGHWFSCAPRHGINLCRTKRAAQSSVNFARKIDVLQVSLSFLNSASMLDLSTNLPCEDMPTKSEETNPWTVEKSWLGIEASHFSSISLTLIFFPLGAAAAVGAAGFVAVVVVASF